MRTKKTAEKNPIRQSLRDIEKALAETWEQDVPDKLVIQTARRAMMWARWKLSEDQFEEIVRGFVASCSLAYHEDGESVAWRGALALLQLPTKQTQI